MESHRNRWGRVKYCSKQAISSCTNYQDNINPRLDCDGNIEGAPEEEEEEEENVQDAVDPSEKIQMGLQKVRYVIYY